MTFARTDCYCSGCQTGILKNSIIPSTMFSWPFTVRKSFSFSLISLYSMDSDSYLIICKGYHPLLPKMNNLNLLIKKCQTKPNWETFYKINGLHSLKCQDHGRQWILRNCSRLKETKEIWQMQYVVLDGILDKTSKSVFSVKEKNGTIG